MTLKDNQAFATSRDVAEFFGREHKNVLRDIDALQLGGSDLSGLFREHLEYHDKARKLVRGVDMTKDGFTLLAMGFTGAKALQFKLAYINAFNEIEARANAAVPALPDFTNPAAAARAWADELEQKQALKTGRFRP